MKLDRLKRSSSKPWLMHFGGQLCFSSVKDYSSYDRSCPQLESLAAFPPARAPSAIVCARSFPPPNFSTPMPSRANLSQEEESLRTRPLKTLKFLRASRRDSTSSADRPAAPEVLYVGAVAPSAADVVSNGLAEELVRCSVRCGRGRGKASDRGLPGRIGDNDWTCS